MANSGDSLFQPGNGNALLISRIKRTEGSIPYLRRTNQVASTSKVKAPSSNAVNAVSGGFYDSGTINPNTGVQNVGNAFPFYVQGKIGFSATANAITLYWDGTNGSQPLVVKRVDGTSFSVPRGTLTVGGLNAGTLYGFLPFNCLTNQTNVSFCTGDVGSPRFAFSPAASVELKASANQIQNLSSNEALTSSFIYFSTPPAGSTVGEGLPGSNAPYPQVWGPPA